MNRENMIRERLVDLVDTLLVTHAATNAPALSARDAASLGDLITALERLDNGNYETCNACGGPIGEERLLEAPTMALCPGCASDESWRPFNPH